MELLEKVDFDLEKLDFDYLDLFYLDDLDETTWTTCTICCELEGVGA
jgi:predicted aldo/keto reductase-like oxidoreductase